MSDLLSIYEALHAHFGPQHWWPAETPFEVMVGAILTQNAAWPNVERAIGNLKRARKLDPHAILALPTLKLQQLIRPSGFFRVKARRLQSFVKYFVDRYGGDIARMRRVPLSRLRPELLAVHGVGRETADSILLYALNKPTFVIDAYTRRVLSRHQGERNGDNYPFSSEEKGLVVPDFFPRSAQDTMSADYEDLRRMFESNLPRRARLYNEYHALLVRLAKTYCRVKPLCSGCPLESQKNAARLSGETYCRESTSSGPRRIRIASCG